MSSHDPRQLKVVLEDLQHYLGIWSGSATDTLRESDYSQTITREYVNRAIHETSMVKSQAEKDALQASSKQPEYDSLSAKTDEAVATARDTLIKAQEAYQKAQQTLAHWQSELEKAIAWLERAKIRLEKAKLEYERAKSNVERAENRVERAKNDLERCRNDENRRDCRSEAREVERAIDDLRDARHELKIAKAELDAAIADYNRAVARVNCCRQAVEYAREAVAHAEQAKMSATNGDRMAALSAEYAKEVQKLFKFAKKKSEDGIKTSVEMGVVVREATESTDMAQLHLAQADALDESAQGYYYRVDTELSSRINSLVQLNQPLPVSTPSKGMKGNTVIKTRIPTPKSKEGVHGYRYQKARKEFMIRSLSDPSVGKHIKGWIAQEIRRSGKSGYWKSPPGYDVGHRTPGIDKASNLRWENSSMNRSRGAKHKR